MNIPTNSPMVGAHPEVHAYQTIWLVGIVTNEFVDRHGKSNAPVLSHTFPNGPKNLAGFLNFLVRISINYRRNLMPPTKKKLLFNVPSETLKYKTPLPRFIFSLGSSFLFLFLTAHSIYIWWFARGFIVLLVVFNILKGKYSYFFIFVFFFNFNYDYFFDVLYFVYFL